MFTHPPPQPPTTKQTFSNYSRLRRRLSKLNTFNLSLVNSRGIGDGASGDSGFGGGMGGDGGFGVVLSCLGQILLKFNDLGHFSTAKTMNFSKMSKIFKIEQILTELC